MTMDEAEQLQQRIDYWQGTKTQHLLPPTHASLDRIPLTAAGLIDDHLEHRSGSEHAYRTGWVPRRGFPYGVRRARGQLRGGRGQYRHNTLVVNNPVNPPMTATGSPNTATNDATHATDQFISTTGRHKQLINSNIYNRVTQQRTKDMGETLNVHRQEKAAREAARLQTYFAKSRPPAKSKFHEILVEDIRFRVTEGGSKLVNISNHPVDQVPRRTIVGGVNFFRSKHGNLYRAGIVKSKLCVAGHHGRNGSLTPSRPTQKSPDLCPTFSSTGNASVLRLFSQRAIPYHPQRAANQLSQVLARKGRRAGTPTIQKRWQYAKISYRRAFAQLVTIATFLMIPPLIERPPASTSCAASAPTRTVATPISE